VAVLHLDAHSAVHRGGRGCRARSAGLGRHGASSASLDRPWQHGAHTFDNFAPRLTDKYHVYGITRRGFGESSAPVPDDKNYAADRLGDDVLAVMDALRLDRPVLAGASVAGEETSSIGSRFPEKVAGLIYLDAGLSFAYYDGSQGDLHIDAMELRKKVERLTFTGEPRELKPLVRELLQTDIPQLERHLRKMHAVLEAMPEPAPKAEAETEMEAPLPRRAPATPAAVIAIRAGTQKYSGINCPVLSIFADRSDFSAIHKDDPAARAAAEAIYVPRRRAQMDAFEAGVPQARVVRLANADHAVYRSNLEDVLREIDEFVATLT
jgi:non-heme chloroperoxidase